MYWVQVLDFIRNELRLTAFPLTIPGDSPATQ
jgi:hypothetical protein